MTSDEQLAEWLKGNSIHNDTRDECCPDFSCCTPKLLADEDMRKAFVAADDDARISMLGMFLGAAIAEMGKDKEVYLAGFDEPSVEH